MNTVPGSFDADMIAYDGKSIQLIGGFGWVLLYKGVRWDEENGRKTSSVGFGVIVLDEENPEKILYRSTEPVNGEVWKLEGWLSGNEIDEWDKISVNMEAFIPEKVRFEIRRMNDLIRKGVVWSSHMTRWLKMKSGMLQAGK